MSVLNLGLQCIGLARSKMPEQFEKEVSKCNTLAEIHKIASRVDGLDIAIQESFSPGEDDLYAPFIDVFGTQTSEKHHPSLKRKQATRKNTLPSYASVQYVRNIELMVQCQECGQWRLIYSNCGSKLSELNLPEEFKYVEIRSHSCGDPIEKLYYAAKLEPICIYCGKEQPYTVPDEYPQCSHCRDKPSVRQNDIETSPSPVQMSQLPFKPKRGKVQKDDDDSIPLPSPFPLPKHYPYMVENALKTKQMMKDTMSKFVSVIAGAMSTYRLYPTSQDYINVSQSVITAFSHLKSPTGSPYGAIVCLLNNRFKEFRTDKGHNKLVELPAKHKLSLSDSDESLGPSIKQCSKSSPLSILRVLMILVPDAHCKSNPDVLVFCTEDDNNIDQIISARKLPTPYLLTCGDLASPNQIFLMQGASMDKASPFAKQFLANIESH
uniref:Uncharacterized protein n=1 Tax=Amphimedon queenslandica TaxID=400682 RepID=A0A1X7UMC9_AMPQE